MLDLLAGHETKARLKPSLGIVAFYPNPTFDVLCAVKEDQILNIPSYMLKRQSGDYLTLSLTF